VYRQIDLFGMAGIDYVIVNLDPTNEIKSLENLQKVLLRSIDKLFDYIVRSY
jgi:hypothetical protein